MSLILLSPQIKLPGSNTPEDEFADQVAFNFKFNLASSGKALAQNFPKLAATTFNLSSNFKTALDPLLNLVGFTPTGTYSYLGLNDPSNLYTSLNKTVTYELWVRRLNSDTGILMGRCNQDSLEWRYNLQDSGRLEQSQLYVKQPSGNINLYTIPTPGSYFPMNKLVHIAIVYNAAEKKRTIFFDGKPCSSAEINKDITTVGHGLRVTIGSDHLSGGLPFSGTIFGVRVTMAAKWGGAFTPPGVPVLG